MSKKHKNIKKRKKKSKKVSANSYGKFGVIQRTDNHTKHEEFIAWLIEVKKLNINAISKIEEKNLRQEFIEDFNTATLPHKKFYNIRKWEEKQSKKRSKVTSEDEKLEFGKTDAIRDEERLLRERREERENWKMANEKMRLQKMVDELKAAKESKRSAYNSALDRHRHPESKATFESIAEKRIARNRKNVEKKNGTFDE
ncbi:hypothetical protein MHBO_001148 [Bonamia ostreae]|uniref:Uncharacterized protein n=1 Tax=Bonamia ostreae TaxID=126728 RepID=A0ABV2AHX7_9EUKA